MAKYITKLISGETMYYLKDSEARESLGNKVDTTDSRLSDARPASNTVDTYSSTGTDPVSGKAVAAAIGTLDVSSVGGTNKYIKTISETNGKISATAGTVDTSVTADSSNLITSGAVKAAIDALPEPMVFKGSLGTDGTVTSLPTAAAANKGFTYKVITAGTYASQAAKVGDTFISDGSSWILIPSGDEPSGTVTSVTIKATSPISIDSSSAITSSGTRTISHAASGVTAGTYKSVTVDAKGHVTAGTSPTTLAGYGITDAKIANGTITLGSNTITPLTSHQTTETIATNLTAAGYKLTDTTYNFSGTSFTSNNNTGLNADNVTYNSHTYYSVNGPTKTLGASTTDGALYTLAYSASWVCQIAQDYRNGNLFTRGKNNGIWLAWRKVMYSDDTYDGTLTKLQVTTALGYTPPTSDTNTHRPILVNDTLILGNNTTALNLKAGSNVSLSNDSGTVTIAATNTTYSAGTKALLDAGTNTSNRVWPASAIADYVTGLGYLSGIVAINNGGTGASTRLDALKNLTNENVSTNAQYFLTITSLWGKGGYTSVADAKTVLAMTGATDSAAGTAGVVPAPAKGKQTSFLRGDGTWVVPTNTTYSDFVKSGSSAAHGLVPKPPTTAGTTKYLREDGTWAVPTDTNTDTKVTGTRTEPASALTWYPLCTTSVNTSTESAIKNPYIDFRILTGTAETGGYSRLLLGNGVAVGTEGNMTGSIIMYGTAGKYVHIVPHNDDTTNRTFYTPKSSGTLVVHTTDTAIGSSTQPVYISAAGVATAIGHTIAADVPSGAKFTDTTYSAGTLALYNTGTNTAQRVWSANVLKSIGNQYLPLAGGTMTGSVDFGNKTMSGVSDIDGVVHIIHYPNSTTPTNDSYACRVSYKNMDNAYLEIVNSTSSRGLRYYDGSKEQNLWMIGKDDGDSLYVGDGSVVTTVRGLNARLLCVDGSTAHYCFLANKQGNACIGEYANRDYTYKLNVIGAVGATGYNNTSDIRKKDIIENVDLSVEDIANAPIFKFLWLDPEMDRGVNVGSSAQYWQTVLPEIVSEADDDEKTLSMQYGVAALTSSVTLAKKVVEQEKTIKAQEERIKALEDAILEILSKLNN